MKSWTAAVLSLGLIYLSISQNEGATTEFPTMNYEGRCALDMFTLIEVGDTFNYRHACLSYTCMKRDETFYVQVHTCDAPHFENVTSGMICNFTPPTTGNFPDCCLKVNCIAHLNHTSAN
uniref:U-scoloptoxin(16)-Er11a n=1 Tax=Ethmostigmus rubripes TaxID=62613 RepID=TXGBA_ETHRU|nr:RecName: Full=U-scoloptoxin(16)-Er11a; Short=U-SLPTX(16)-Er11a; Flags: Precursor [Ethmostigmus rubripes]